jgi:hypothetical protein
MVALSNEKKLPSLHFISTKRLSLVSIPIQNEWTILLKSCKWFCASFGCMASLPIKFFFKVASPGYQ